LPERDKTIETVEYSDGFGRLLQTRTQAEDILFGDPSFGGGVLVLDQSVAMGDTVGRQRADDNSPNVIVSGSQIYDNKGRIVEKFERFFSTGLDYSAPDDSQLGRKVNMFYDPRGQVIRTLNPDGSEQRVIYGIPVDLTNPDRFAPTPWEVYNYDANDLAPVSKGPDGKSLINAAPASHHFTPSSIVIDALGRTIESIARNGSDRPDWFVTRFTYDIRGNVLTLTDALGRAAFRYTYDFANRPWRIKSIDADLHLTALNVLGNETERRDSKGALILHAYDRLHRPIRLWARDDASGPITLRQRLEYGDAGTPDQAAPQRAAMRAMNLLGQLHRHHDEAGLTTMVAMDFKANILDKSRRVIADAPILAVFDEASATGWQVRPFQIQWQPRPQQTLADRESELLETRAYRTAATYDALNRIKRLNLPQDVDGQRLELRPMYNNAGGLEKVFLNDTVYLERIAYDAKGQRALIAYGNGVMTRYAYDPHTFRLKRLRTERYSKPDDLTYRPTGEALQDFGYDYDLLGNILGIRDRVQGSGVLNNPEAAIVGDSALAQLLVRGDALDRHFDYDPVYRLLSATGRECDRPRAEDPWQDKPRCTDLTKSRTYTERYRYDAMGNLLTLEHRNGAGGFSRKFTLETANNRLRRMQIGDTDYDYTFDGSGNTRSETISRQFEWNHSNQMKAFRTQAEGAEPSVYGQYLYDATGQRVKKLVRKQGGQIELTHYIDGWFEHHRWRRQSQAGENNYVHVMDDSQRIVLVRLGSPHPDDRAPAVQFHLGDHLGSSNVVVDTGGALINREEFTPYGETSFGSFARKRYRFTGKERDEESGLNYHGARYFSPSIGRWLTCDPLMASPSRSGYEYSSSCPINRVDPTGNDDTEALNAASVQEATAIYPGSEYKVNLIRTREYQCNGCECETTYANTVTVTANREGLKSHLTKLAGGALTSFEQSLVDKWTDYDSPKLTPLLRVGGGGTVGYELTTGHTGDRVTTLYTRSGEEVREFHAEVGLVNMGLGAIDYINLARGALSLAKGIGKFAAKRGAAGAESLRLGGGKGSDPIPASEIEEFAGGRPASTTRAFVHDLSNVTGRGAYVRNRMIDTVIKKDLPGLRLTYRPQYNPFLEPVGVSSLGNGTQLGKLAFSSRLELIDTIVHEELHHRWWARGILGSHHGPLFDATIERYLKLKGFK
jgi:RHS repeat-associated protein